MKLSPTPFGGLHLDTADVADHPLKALSLAQPQLERTLAELAEASGADLRRGHNVVSVHQNDVEVVSDVVGPLGRYSLTARYLVGCDGSRSQIRRGPLSLSRESPIQKSTGWVR